MDKKDILYIVIPAYNEKDNIMQCINDWYPIVELHDGDGLSRLVIINDGSKDNTYEIIQEAQKSRPLLKGITKSNGGHGSALIYGYKYAISQNADFIFQTDSDGQTNPNEFGAFWKKRKKYDAILGYRKERGDGKSRFFVEKVLCLILRMIFGVKLPDANAPFRLMKREVLEKYIDRFEDDYHLPNVMLTTFFVYYKEKIRFANVSFKPRQAGTNSINLKKIVKIGLQSIKDFAQFRKNL